LASSTAATSGAPICTTFDLVEKALAARGPDGLQIAPSCSLIHSPVDLDGESKLDAELKSWMAFATQKLGEVATLAAAATNGRKSVEPAFQASYEAARSRDTSARIHNPKVAERIAAVSAKDLARQSPFEARRKRQRGLMPLPSFPTTTIGSFPQTAEVREARAAHRKGELDDATYNAFLKKETENAVRIQEELDIDVLVHVASSSATTWSSISASNWPDSLSPRTAGCSPTARAT
jgi:5-methyltetrahydropteroyltriglutamate--homocysteine methyltransferase